MTTDELQRSSGPLTLKQIAELVGGRFEGDPSLQVQGVASIEDAGPEHMAYFTSKRYAKFVPGSGAGAFLVTEEMDRYVPEGRPKVVVAQGAAALASILERFDPDEPQTAGVHPTAVLGEGIVLGEDVGIGPYAVIGDGVEIGSGTRVGAHAAIGSHARIGQDCTLHPHVVLYARTELGNRVILHAGARVGVDGFGYAAGREGHRKIPHVGRCIVGDDVEIGANTTVDRGSVGDTLVEPGVKIDNLCQIGHNARVGALTIMPAMIGVAGSTRVGRGVLMGGQVGIIDHLTIGDGAQIAAGSLIYRNVKEGEQMSGRPARSHREELRRQAHLSRLPKLAERVKDLQAQLEALKESLGP